jgi:hypothetical protein
VRWLFCFTRLWYIVNSSGGILSAYSECYSWNGMFVTFAC